MTHRSNDCVGQPHIHVGICQRAGYANGLADAQASAVLTEGNAELRALEEVHRRLRQHGHVGGALFVVRDFADELRAALATPEATK